MEFWLFAKAFDRYRAWKVWTVASPVKRIFWNASFAVLIKSETAEVPFRRIAKELVGSEFRTEIPWSCSGDKRS